MNNFFNLILDDKKFMVSKSSIYSITNFLLRRILENKVVDPNISVDGNNIFINRDPGSFSYIVDILRGYSVNLKNIKDDSLKSKVNDDLKYFGFSDNQNNNEESGDELATSKSGLTTEGINLMLKNMESKLKEGDVMNVINSISTSDVVKDMIGGFLQNQNLNEESDVESIESIELDIEEDPIDDSSELETDIYTILDSGQKLVTKLFKL